jgi:lipopolysaccharide export system permease protein
MIKHIDWLLVKGYFKAYLVCLVSLLSLYVIIDLFTNLDEFGGKQRGLGAVLQQVGAYYAYRSAKIFDQLCEPIVLLAAMFTVAWVQRNNELLPLLSAGVSTRRVVLPVLASAWLMLSLAVANAELVIPRIAGRLSFQKGDPEGAKDVLVRPGHETNGIQIDGGVASRQGMLVRPFNVTIPSGVGKNMIHLSAAEARYIPPGSPGERGGGWLLTGTEPAVLDGWDNADVLEPIDPGKYFLYTREVDFAALTRNPKWFQLASTAELYRELQKPETARVAQLAVLFHMRLTRPILGMILVLMGLSVLLTDQGRNVLISAGMCLVLCAVFFGGCFASQQLGDTDILSPALAAWLPVLVFGPLSLVMFDAVHT